MANGDISWRCTVRICTSTIQTNSKISNILTEDEIISHDYNIVKNRDIQLQIVCNNCKRKATECISERPNKIIYRELMAVENTELLHDDMSMILGSVLVPVPIFYYVLTNQIMLNEQIII